jgi:hypothetical protein
MTFIPWMIGDPEIMCQYPHLLRPPPLHFPPDWEEQLPLQVPLMDARSMSSLGKSAQVKTIAFLSAWFFLSCRILQIGNKISSLLWLFQSRKHHLCPWNILK